MKKLSLMILILFLLLGCSATIPQQIRDQGGTALDVNRATYLQALIWYNDNQEAFTNQVSTLDPVIRMAIKSKIIEINDLFNAMAIILDQWRDATILLDMDTGNAQWTATRNRLIDAGLNFLVKQP